MIAAQVVVNEYQLQHSCMTVDELRWLMRKVKRHSPYYAYFLLRITTGIRGGELLDVQLSQFRDHYWRFTYRVQKPKNSRDRQGRQREWNKFRTVELDPWVRSELLEYLELHMVVQVQPDGSRLYLSPYNREDLDKQGQRRVTHGLLFPWKDLPTVLSYWHKVRQAAVLAGYDARRVERQYAYVTNNRIMEDNTYVWRPHILRAVYCTVRFYRVGMDYKAVAQEIMHSKAETTWHYVRAAKDLGCTSEYLSCCSWAELLGFDERLDTLSVRCVPQMSLESFGSGS